MYLRIMVVHHLSFGRCFDPEDPSIGLLNARVLQAFRASEIRSLSLSASLIDQDGLNISGSDSLRGNV